MSAPLNVLFLCTGNSARSVIAESLLNARGQQRFHAFSAGSHPSGTLNALVLEYLASEGIATAGLRSKSWDEFAAPGASIMDLVVTVCDQAAGESCPIWPGHPAKAHWGEPDPAAYMHDLDEARGVIRAVFNSMDRRIERLLRIPVHQLSPATLREEARAIAALA